MQRFMMNLKSLFLIWLLPLGLVAQKFKKSDKVIIKNLHTHIEFLASDKLEGRRAGTPGEALAIAYIRKQFEKIGLEPMGDSGKYYQSFKINEGKNYEEKTSLFINNEEISQKDYFPEPFSPEINVEGAPFISLKESGSPWLLDINEDLLTAKSNPHFTMAAFLAAEAKNAAKKGATALFLFNSDPAAADEQYDGKSFADPAPIPVVMLDKSVAAKYFKDENASVSIKLNIGFTENVRTAHNVIGYINNGAPTTVVLGAHLDHLGYGEDGNALGQTAGNVVYNGADDNASGIAALIELSRLLKTSWPRGNNYLFIAFSGEELGLLGSKYFVEHPTVDLASVNYMINLDMVGRLNQQTRVVTVGGYGTSPTWGTLLDKLGTNKFLTSRYDSSGSGPSDHTSFYRKDIPVLFFFTGVHPDYHKPSDDIDKINVNGEYLIVQYIYKIIEAANTKGKLAFTKTRDNVMGTTARFSVTMGIMPDYAFQGEGVRIDGVSSGRPAEKAQLQTGDVILQMGDFKVSTLEDYMQALGKFKQGDQTKVSVKRNDKMLEADITF